MNDKDFLKQARKYSEPFCITNGKKFRLKDVDPGVLARLASGELEGFGAAVRARIFTELGAGALDLMGCLRSLAVRDYAGWLMVEQDSSWQPPTEAAAIGRRVLAHALRIVGSGPSIGPSLASRGDAH